MAQHPRIKYAGKSRRGVSTPMLLMCVMAGLLFVVMAVDLAQLSLQRKQMQCGVDAATVSAVDDLMDRRWLYLGPEGSQPDEDFLNALPELQQASAIVEAQTFAASNRVAGKPIELFEEGVFFGYISHPGAGDDNVLAPAGSKAANTISVELTRSKLGDNPPILWLAEQTGLSAIDITVRSRASVATRIHGFHPLPRVTVPIIPLGLFEHRGEGAAPSHAGGSSAVAGDDDRPSQLWWAQGPHDRYTVDPRTGNVSPGKDGIAEMVFRLRGEGNSSSGDDDSHAEARPSALMGFHEDHLDVDEFLRLAVVGAHAGDFARYGGSITLGDDRPALCPAAFSLNSRELSEIWDTLRRAEVFGRPRIWPVVADCSSVMGGKSTVGIIGFVAGCVAHCEMDNNDGSLIVTIQPCLLQTPTALTDGSAQRNPWIGKLLLVR